MWIKNWVITIYRVIIIYRCVRIVMIYIIYIWCIIWIIYTFTVASRISVSLF